MTVTETESSITGVPNYYLIYKMWHEKYEQTGDQRSKTMAQHYARVAEEMGQAYIDDDTTQSEIIFEKR